MGFKTTDEWSIAIEKYGKDPAGDPMWDLGRDYVGWDDVPAHERRGRSREAIINSSDWTGPPLGTCKKAARVWRHYGNGTERVLSVTWNKHQIALGLPVELSVLLLKQCRREGWSEATLVFRVDREKTQWPKPVGGDIVADLKTLLLSGIRFSQVEADPPWRFIREKARRGSGRHFPSMSLEELLALADLVHRLTTDVAYLHIWIPVALLHDGLRLCEAWGFHVLSKLEWLKIDKKGDPEMGPGRFWRPTTETCYFAVRGRPPAFQDPGMPGFLSARRGLYGQKPPAFYDLVERAAPGPILQLFGTRRHSARWTPIGNHIAMQNPPVLPAAAD
jgi:N6-adenosine-specific RNA methylase IME4